MKVYVKLRVSCILSRPLFINEKQNTWNNKSSDSLQQKELCLEREEHRCTVFVFVVVINELQLCPVFYFQKRTDFPIYCCNSNKYN